MMILIFASPHPALETDGTEDNWRADTGVCPYTRPKNPRSVDLGFLVPTSYASVSFVAER